MVSNQAQGKLCHGSLFIGNKWWIAMFKKQKERRHPLFTNHKQNIFDKMGERSRSNGR